MFFITDQRANIDIIDLLSLSVLTVPWQVGCWAFGQRLSPPAVHRHTCQKNQRFKPLVKTRANRHVPSLNVSPVTEIPKVHPGGTSSRFRGQRFDWTSKGNPYRHR